MIVDTSALLAIALGEPEETMFIDVLVNANHCRLSAGSLIELAAVAIRGKLIKSATIDQMVIEFGLTVEAVTAEQAKIGQHAYARYGVGTGHPARLNFGDCFAYALAVAMREPLLFKGDDFIHTDVVPAALN